VGADVIVPWAAARCVTRWKAERGAKALAKWRTTVREAAKQSRRARFPEVTALASTADVATWLRGAALGAVLHEEATAPLAAAQPPERGDVVVVVGPEGGLGPDELAAFAAAGATSYRLGPTVLRTSTAGVAALSVLLARTPRWA
ncbi:MAG: RsmE family RNA methyltransferase, partial [Actinomycetes bacterium]